MIAFYNNDHLIIIYGLCKSSNPSVKNANPSFSYPIDRKTRHPFGWLVFLRLGIPEGGFERRLLATVRWTVATAVAFPQKSESTVPGPRRSEGANLRETSFWMARLSALGHLGRWIRKAALGDSPVDCRNRRGFSAEKRIHLPPPERRDAVWCLAFLRLSICIFRVNNCRISVFLFCNQLRRSMETISPWWMRIISWA